MLYFSACEIPCYIFPRVGICAIFFRVWNFRVIFSACGISVLYFSACGIFVLYFCVAFFCVWNFLDFL